MKGGVAFGGDVTCEGVAACEALLHVEALLREEGVVLCGGLATRGGVISWALFLVKALPVDSLSRVDRERDKSGRSPFFFFFFFDFDVSLLAPFCLVHFFF